MMKTLTHTMQTFMTVATVSGMFLSPQVTQAQIRGIDLGAAFKPAFEAIAKQMADAMRRRLVMDPAELSLSAVDSMLTITVTNNYKDSARALIKIHASPPFQIILPDTVAANQTKKSKRSLVADDAPSDSGVAYKDLTPWITSMTSEIRLAPGERKTITVSVRVPTSASTGEYAAWVAAHVVIPSAPGNAKPDTVESSARSPSGKSTKIQTTGVSSTMAPGTQIVSATKVVVTK